MKSLKGRPSIRSTLAGVVAHPTRVKALNILNERSASPVEIARELKLEVSHVSHHVKELVVLGAAELVDERKVRGAIEHIYRATSLAYVSDEEWAKLPIEKRRPHTLYALQLSMADAARALDGDTFDARPDRYLTRTRALVDEEGWREFNELHRELLERTMEIKAASADRIAADTEAPTLSVMQIAMFFEEPSS